jgi:hypothetical protein
MQVSTTGGQRFDAVLDDDGDLVVFYEIVQSADGADSRRYIGRWYPGGDFDESDVIEMLRTWAVPEPPFTPVALDRGVVWTDVDCLCSPSEDGCSRRCVKVALDQIR